MSQEYLTLDPQDLSTGELHGYLLTAVAPRPIAFASTIDEQGRVNLSPFSFFNVFGSNPPLMIFSSARRVRDNTTKHTLDNVKAVPEVVINIVNFPIVEQMSLASTEYPQGVNEFVKAGLPQVPSSLVKPPRVGNAPAAFECKVEQVIETGSEGGAGNLIIARVVKMHLRREYLNEDNKLDTRKLDLVGRMGGSDYVRANGAALFEIPKPLRTRGIGVDQLPESVRLSPVLTGNELGRLGNIESWPEPAAAAAYLANHSELLNLDAADQQALHQSAQQLLQSGETLAAANLLAAKT